MSPQVNELLVHLSPSSQLTRSLTTTLAEDFAHSPSWTQRQTFASLCARLVTPPHCAFGEGRITGSSFREGKMANNYFEERRHSAVYDDATLAERDKGESGLGRYEIIRRSPTLIFFLSGVLGFYIHKTVEFFLAIFQNFEYFDMFLFLEYLRKAIL